MAAARMRCVLLMICSVLVGQALADSLRDSSAATRGQPTYRTRVERHVIATMRDGVKLVSDIYRPDVPGKFPALLVRTPYGRQGGAAVYKLFAEHGYAVVVQDVRGRYDSGGEAATNRTMVMTLWNG